MNEKQINKSNPHVDHMYTSSGHEYCKLHACIVVARECSLSTSMVHMDGKLTVRSEITELNMAAGFSHSVNTGVPVMENTGIMEGSTYKVHSDSP